MCLRISATKTTQNYLSQAVFFWGMNVTNIKVKTISNNTRLYLSRSSLILGNLTFLDK